MNMVKRIMGRPRQEECNPQDNALGLMHLRRLFSELCHPPRHMTQKEQEEKLYMMLPVFNRVFGNAPPNTMNEKFSDLLHDSVCVCTPPTEAASRAIVQFLEVNQSEEASRGWMLLTTINLLASSGQKTVDCMTTMSVPSTLVKCLYLFFDLPHMPEVPAATQPELPLADRRALLQKVFVQILVKLCSFVSPAEELAQKDDLQLLFSAITSWCPPHNLPWRKSAGEVLTTISRHGLSVNVVKYIHEKECLSTCIQNMQQSDDLSPLEIVEMFAGLSCFLKDSSDVSQTLLDDFRMCQGYTFLVDLMIRLEQAKEEESKDALKDLVNLVTALTTYGVSELKPAGLTTGAPFLLPGFVVPQPSGKGHTVRNIQAFSVLQNAFLKAKSGRLARMILEAIANIYAADYANYFILEAQHALSQFADRVAKLPEVQSKYFEVLEFVVFGLNYVPCKELFSVSVLLKSSTSYGCSITATRTLLKLGRHHPVFSDVFREVGLLEVLVNLLHKYAALLKDPMQAHGEQGDAKNNVAEEQKQLAWLVMETLTVLLQGSNTNAGLFREFGGARCVHNIVKYRQCREHALMIIQQLVLSPSGDDDMGTLLGLMHSAPSTELQLKTDILRALLAVLRESHRTRTVFRKVGGFVCIYIYICVCVCFFYSMTLSMEGFGPDSVFTINEDNSQYRISRSLVRSAEGSTVPLTRVKCLVSMTTPHDIRLHGSSVTPAFVEFDTSLEGFGCLFLPSLAPHNAPFSNANTSGVSDGAVVSGMGNGERFFPPPSGLSYSTWFCVERFSTPPQSPPVRLLTVVRRATSSEQHYVCLAIVLSAKDRSLIVSTKEELLQTYVDDFSEESSFYEILPCCARFRCADLITEGQWHHLVLVMSKGMLKNSMATLYIDGQMVSTVKLHYVHNAPGGSASANPPVVSTVYSYIGTPPAQRQLSALVWRLGPTHFLEEVLPAASVAAIYELGPNYVGSFQAVYLPCKDSKTEAVPPCPVALVPEEKVSFSLFAHSASTLTVAKLRKVYNKLDSKTIAKQLGVSSHESATPVKLVHNAVGHLNGSARTIGAAVIGYLGVRAFVTKPVATNLQYIGGAAAILGLVAMASDVEGLYAAVKALVCVVKSNPLASKEMERIKGYQLLAMLLKKKRPLLNSHILHLTFSLVGTVDSGHETSIIPNSTAFQDLLCDFEVWLHAPYELHLSLFEHFIELLTESSEAAKNAKLLREFQLIPKLLLTLRDQSLSQPTIAAIGNVLSLLLQGFPNSYDLLRFGQFISSTLPTFAVCEKFVIMENTNEEKIDRGADDEFGGLLSSNLILLRNRLLDILLKLLFSCKEKNIVNAQACEELVRTLGFDWLLMFMEEHIHSSTVTAALLILVVLMSNQSILSRFKEGLSGGGWLDHTDSVLTNKIGTVLGFNVGRSAGGRSTVREINRDACHFPGFPVLQTLLPKHTNVPEIYFMLMALFLQQPITELPDSLQVHVSICTHLLTQFDLDSIWTFIFGVPASSATVVGSIHNMCTEAAFLLLAMLRSMLNLPWQSEEEGSWLREYPITLMQFFRYLYHNIPDLAPMWHSPDFLCTLAATVFPFNIRPYSEMVSDLDDEASSPTEEFKAFVTDTGMNRSQSEYCNVGNKTYLTNHPAKKYVFDFMRVLIMDNLCMTPASKQTPIIDLLLEAAPERSTRTQQKEFQSYILDSVMEQLLAADVLLGEEASLPITTGGSYQILVNNVFYFTQRVVDKLWQGMFNKESKLVVEFIVQLITQSKRRSQGLSLDSIYHCLNRTILYQLSRPHKTVPQQVTLLDSLRVLTVNRNLVLGPGNHDQEFVACLAHCLINLHTGSVEGFGLEAEARMTTWHVAVPSENESDNVQSQDVSEGRQLLLKAVNRVWTELMHSKRQMLEDIFKVSLPVNDRGHVDIATARPALEEPAAKSWQNHLVHEKKCISRGETVAPANQSKLSRVSSNFGLSKLTGSRRSKKESGMNKNNLSAQETFQWMFTHIAVVRDLVAMQYKEHQERQQNALKYVMDEWAGIEYELLRERGLWGPPIGSHLDKFQLDMTEGPCRMRKKMVRNDMFYIHYPYVPDPEEIPSPRQPSVCDTFQSFQKPVRYRRAISYDSKEYYMRLLSGNPGMYQHSIEQNTEGETTQQEPEHGEDTIARVKGLVKAPLKRSRSTADGADEDSQDQLQELLESGAMDEEQKTDNTTLLRLLEEGEKIQHMYRCARVQGLDTSEGLLLFGKEHFYVIDGFTMTVTREIRDIETLPANMHEPIIPRGARQSKSQLKRTCSIFAYEDIREVHKRRYLLQPMAVEVFSGDGRNYLLAFQKGVRNKVYQRFLAVVPSLADSSESVSGQRPNTSVEQGSGLLSTLVGEKSVTQRWERGEISNFQYLMHLNTLAGRSYNDLMQYPVFPWILADFDSEELDLNNPKTFRNLSKPMGAQTDDRLIQYKKRFKDWEDPTGETPAYHYGTHYSSAMIVASYLVRMEPFTQIFLRLQGGHFDLADRMFHSVREAWLSASKHNMADVKELIPEFFYLPEFLLNSNNFDLGSKQNGTKLGDVILPPWAKGDPREFIRVHREALECDYVSAHLHEWIDLIFGYKQQGPPAVEAVNVFHHLFYEGQVDIYNINDPLKETATIGFINNFGQIPKQLFKKPHPPKRVRSKSNGEVPGVPVTLNSSLDKFFFHHLDNLRPSLTPVKELKEPVGQIVCTDKGILAVEQNKVLVPPAWNKTFAWGYADLSCRLSNYESDKAVVVYECLSEWGQILCAICPNPKLVITGGLSTAICVWETGTSKEKAKTITLKQALLGHTDAVTCLTASSAYHIIVSGSRDRTCIIWDLNKLSFVTQLRGHRAPVSALCINELTGDIVSCAGTYIHAWSINGSPIASANTFTGRSQQILCCCISEMNEWDTQNVIVTGHSDGVVRFWRIEFLQVPETPAPEPVDLVLPEGRDAPEDDSSESEGEEANLSQDSKPRTSNSQPSSTVHRPKPRTGASWSVDSGSDDSRRWSDTLSIDEKDGFVFVNYSEGQIRPGIPSQPHLQPHSATSHGPVPQPLQPSTMEARSYNNLIYLFENIFCRLCYGQPESDSWLRDLSQSRFPLSPTSLPV
uniref:WD repeat and FYVE domain-containing protein 3-like n=1 Tax=Sinocyclocheilus rhinocerous TaxID=307959 RepID=A0A673H4N5_9TELE